MTQEELRGALNIQERINRINENIAKKRATCGVGGVSGNEPVTGGTQPVTIGQQIVELEDEIKELQPELEKQKIIVKWHIEKYKETLGTVLHRLLLFRYVECMVWERVSDKISYSTSYTKTTLAPKAENIVLDSTQQYLQVQTTA